MTVFKCGNSFAVPKHYLGNQNSYCIINIILQLVLKCLENTFS